MIEKLSLRLRVMLFFVFVMVVSLGALAAGLWVGAHTQSDGFVLAGIIGGFGIIGVTLWVWFLFDQNVALPIVRLAGALSARTHGQVSGALDAGFARYLGDLAPAVQDIAQHLDMTRTGVSETVKQHTTRLSLEKEQLAGIASDVLLGIVLCSSEHRIVFYNGAAAQMLGPQDHPGLNHSIADYLAFAPLHDAYQRLCASRNHAAGPVSTLISSTVQSGRVLSGFIRLLHPATADDPAPGYVLTLDNMAIERDILARRAALSAKTMRETRALTVSLRTAFAAQDALPSLADNPVFRNAMLFEANKLSQRMAAIMDEYDNTRVGLWPFETISARDFVSALQARLAKFPAEITSADPDLSADIAPLAIVETLAFLVTQVIETHKGRAVSVLLARDPDLPDGAMISIGWTGDVLLYDDLQMWLDRDIDFGLPDVNARRVLTQHSTDCWPVSGVAAQRQVLKIPLPQQAKTRQPARRLAYDFDLLQSGVTGDITDAPLRDLSFVVLDTETTGLAPEKGDEICQIAALRVVNGRIVPGEAVDTFVNPGRAIPPASTAVHHITDDMVADAPDIAEAGRKLHRFARGAVLVAHNAPFDLEFFSRKADVIGATFNNPVLDTVLLSAILFGQTEVHTLDALCARLDISIPPDMRHTAMGDTIATAEAFIRMIPMLEARGIVRFKDVVMQARKHKRLIKDLNPDPQ